MAVALTLFMQIVFMFIFIGLGFVLFKMNKISQQGSREIGTLLLYVVIPVVIIKSFLVERTAENITILLHSVFFSAIAMLITCVISWYIYGKRDGIACFSTAFSNAAFMGVPLIEATVGPHAVFYISMMLVLINGLQWIFGVYVITDDKRYISFDKIKTNPVLIAVVIGVILLMSGIQLGEFPMRVLNTIAAINTPLAMIVIGVYLAQTNLKEMILSRKVHLLSFFRLILIPIVTILVFKLLPFGNVDMKTAILIAAACPVGANVALIAQQFQKDYKTSVEYVCMSTLWSLLTLPFITFFIA